MDGPEHRMSGLEWREAQKRIRYLNVSSVRLTVDGVTILKAPRINNYGSNFVGRVN